jgi:hypothetical protein
MAIMAVALTTTFTITACSSDDDDNGDNTEQTIVGNWVITEDWYSGKDGWTKQEIIWNFYKDSTGEYANTIEVDDKWKEVYPWYDAKYAVDGIIYLTHVYNWKLSGNKVTLDVVKTRIWQDGTYKKKMEEFDLKLTDINNPTIVGTFSISYLIEFLDSNCLKLTEIEDDGKTYGWYILQRK